jgi:hypothetical protein
MSTTTTVAPRAALLLTPETATDALLAKLGLSRSDLDANMTAFTTHKAASWLMPKGQHPLFYLKFPVKTPCVARRDDWFETHEGAIIAAADADLAARHAAAPFDMSYSYLSAEARHLLFLQMAHVYQQLAASGNLLAQVSNGCCTNTTTCCISQYQRFLLKAMRQEYTET